MTEEQCKEFYDLLNSVYTGERKISSVILDQLKDMLTDKNGDPKISDCMDLMKYSKDIEFIARKIRDIDDDKAGIALQFKDKAYQLWVYNKGTKSLE